MTRVARRAALISVTGLLIAMAAASTTNAQASPATGAMSGTGPAAGGGPRPGGVSGHDAAVTAGQQAGVRRYWTRARMAGALPLGPGGRAAVGAVAEQPARQRSWQSAAVTVTPGSGPGVSIARAARAALARLLPGQRRRRHHRRPRRALLRGTAGAAATSGAAWTSGGAVTRTTGKVFFSLGGHDYVCSGSTVDSANSDVVVTAAHCVDNPGGAWASNWTFVPGYANGNDPYGSYSARTFYVASQWSAQADNDYDVAFVVVNPATVTGVKVSVGQEAGGQPIAFGGQPAQEVAFGYPADAPYNGQDLYYCSGAVSPDPYHETDDTGLTCVMTAGSSGGPWLAGFDPATGTGTITSVSSFKYSTDSQILYGTPFGPVAQSLYESAQRA